MIVADGPEFTTTGAVVLNAAHPPSAAIAYVTVYEPAVLLPKLIVPLPLLMERPLGLAL